MQGDEGLMSSKGNFQVSEGTEMPMADTGEPVAGAEGETQASDLGL